MTEAIRIAASVVPVAAIFGSLATLWWLFQRHIAGEPPLPYEPRRPVPWNAAAPIALLTFVLAPVLAASLAPIAGPVEATQSADGLSPWAVGIQAVMSVALTFGCHAALAALFGATPRDLGWPSDWATARRDVRIGVITFLAIIVPVYAMQYTLSVLFTPESQHPLIEELQVRHTSPMLFVAFAAAVVGAPLFEETVFRLILQGWLERFTGPWSPEPTRDEIGGVKPTIEVGESPVETPDLETSAEAPTVWQPMIFSGVLFAGAHLGQGIAPISLLPLGVVLGYVYQRTHRILPSIVCHALFNAFSLFVLWLALTSGELTK